MSDIVPEKRKYGVPEYRDTIAVALEMAFSENNLELEEYERRLDLAYKAESIEELEALVHDFPHYPKPGYSPPSAPVQEGDGQTKIVILGDQHLTGEDFSGRAMKTLSIIGDVNIDVRRFRDSREPIRIKIYSIIGDTRIIIPKGMQVQNRLTNLLGDYKLVRNEEPADASSSVTTYHQSQGVCILEGFNLLGDISIREEGSKKKGFLKKFFG